MSIQEALDRFRVETNSKIIPYVVRDHAWNFDHHDKTNFYRYREDTPDGYKDAVKYITPHPTNKPVPPKVILDIKDKEEADDKEDIKEEEARKKKQDAKDKEQLDKEKKEEDDDIAAEKSGKAQVNATQAGLIAANASAKANATLNATVNTTANASVEANATANATAN